MTIRQLAAIVLRLFGLVSVIQAAAHLTLMVSQLLQSGPDSYWGWYGSVGIVVTLVLSGGALLAFTDRLSAILVPHDQPVQIGLGEDWPRSLYEVCIRVAGVIVVVNGVPKVISSLTRYGIFRAESMTMEIPRDIWADGLSAIIYVALGVYLVQGGAFFLTLAGAQRKVVYE
jgi:hypothetical protein